MISITEWIVENNVIIQIILSILTLFATIFVSVFIYLLQRKHEEELEKIQEKQIQYSLEEQAKLFLIDHKEECNYLPWCIFSSNLHRLDNHTRKIYADYCRCRLELQNEILKQAGLKCKQIEDIDWVDSAIKLLQEDIKLNKLGENVLYDNAKYFHRSYERYKYEKYDNIKYEYIFEPIIIDFGAQSFFRKHMCNLSDYIYEYFEYINHEGIIPLCKPNPLPPIDYMCKKINFGEVEEKIVCGWIMEMIEGIAASIMGHKDLYDNIIIDYTDANAETYEDKYYKVLQELYNTYYFANSL